VEAVVAEPEGINWRSGRLAETEYTALSVHHFHEDSYFLRAFGLFGTINTALITLFGTNLIVNVQHSSVRFAFCSLASSVLSFG
jgi:hypothetical protein